MLKAETATHIAGINSSPRYLALRLAGKLSLESVPDCQQYPATAAASGAVSYSKTPSTGAESNNAVVEDSRSLELVTSILWIATRKNRMYIEMAAKAAAAPEFATPHARGKLA